MTTFRQLSPSLRAAITAPWLLLAAAVALGATPAFRQLLIDASKQPTADVSLSSPHWTGTLDPARLPARVVQYDENGNVFVGFDAAFVGSTDGGLNLNGEASSDGNEDWQFPGFVSILGLSVGGGFNADNGNLSTDGTGDLTVRALSVLEQIQAQSILTSTAYISGDVNIQGTLSVGGTPFVDSYGELYYANGVLLTDIGSNLFDASGHVIADSTGNLYAVAGLGVWSTNPPDA